MGTGHDAGFTVAPVQAASGNHNVSPAGPIFVPSDKRLLVTKPFWETHGNVIPVNTPHWFFKLSLGTRNSGFLGRGAEVKFPCQFPAESGRPPPESFP